MKAALYKNKTCNLHKQGKLQVLSHSGVDKVKLPLRQPRYTKSQLNTAHWLPLKSKNKGNYSLMIPLFFTR